VSKRFGGAACRHIIKTIESGERSAECLEDVRPTLGLSTDSLRGRLASATSTFANECEIATNNNLAASRVNALVSI
jgi:hypothetical protein